jgi:dolichol kinase
MIEARPSLLDIDDNFSIPMAFSFLMTGFGFMWG